MPPQGSKTTRKGKRYHFEFSRASLLFWGTGMFFFLAWIFVLGILVGRGVFPEGVGALTELKLQIVRLQNILSRKEPVDLERVNQTNGEPRLEFYDELSTKRKEIPRKDHQSATDSRVQKRPSEGQDKKTGSPPTGGTYALQLASLESETQAATMIARLTDRGYPVYSYKVHVKGKIYYRIRCGIFKTREEADRYKDLLAKEEKMDGFLIRVNR